MSKSSLSAVLAEIAFDLGSQSQNHLEWTNALKKGEPNNNESMEAFFDALVEFKVSSKDKADIVNRYQDLLASKTPNRALVVLGYETSPADRQSFIDSVESKLGPLDWTFETNLRLGGGATLKLGDKKVDLTGISQAQRMFKSKV